ncbi:protoporphyrinogen oxidase [Rhodopirellula rubra]|uniref:Protoporphyrinogen oxidase n=1 Tax=Aporhodopirellula rubra TaxID=980271 RepID=A0A7W5H4F8_9BACT|nr:NAD(P)/FAD-dependent oxidoreductase [Aporhodopirellula rubra]MBB3204786.1 protoporphyrinogen oxidase [Aporhodopirellula rubra]
MPASSPTHSSTKSAPTTSQSDTAPASRWLVIGGGVMGLQVATDLRDRGQNVTIAEAAPTMGGLTSAWNLGDVIWDRFYHVTLMSDTKIRDVLKRLGLESQMKWVETKTGFYAGGRLLSMSNTSEFLKFPPLTLIEKLRLGGTIFYASKIRNWRRLEKLTVEKWLRRWSGRGVFEKIWQPLLQAKLGEAYKQTSAAFIWAHTARMYKARRSGMKTERFGYVPGGYAQILESWVGWLTGRDVTMKTGSPVKNVAPLNSGELLVEFADGHSEVYDNVVSTIASPFIAQSCDALTQTEKDQHSNIRYLGVVCASMLMDKPISQYYVTNITDTWVPLTAVIEMSTIVDPESELDGKHLVYLPKYLPDDHEGLNESDDDYREKCLSTLEKMYDHFSRDQVIEFKIARAKYVAALSTVDYSTRLPPIVTSVPGFYALNSAHIVKGNLNVNETITLGEEKLADEVWPDYQKRVARGQVATNATSRDEELVSSS